MLVFPLCLYCRHLRSGRPVTCDAFPEGIPAVFWLSAEGQHTAPFPGDGGLTFQPGGPLPADLLPDFIYTLPGVEDSPRKREAVGRMRWARLRARVFHFAVGAGLALAGRAVFQAWRREEGPDLIRRDGE